MRSGVQKRTWHPNLGLEKEVGPAIAVVLLQCQLDAARAGLGLHPPGHSLGERDTRALVGRRSGSPLPLSSCSVSSLQQGDQEYKKRTWHPNLGLEKEVELAIAAVLLQRQLIAARAGLGLHSHDTPPLPSLSSSCLPLSSCSTCSLQQERV
jgi:hypothetical protein